MDRKALKRMIQQEIARVKEDFLVEPEEVSPNFLRQAPASSACPSCGMSPCACDDYGNNCPSCGTSPCSCTQGCDMCGMSPCQCDAERSQYKLSCSECGGVMVMQEGCGCGSTPSLFQPLEIPSMDMHDNFQSEHEFGTAHHEGAYMAKAQLHKIEKYSGRIQEMIPPGHDLEDWMRTKISQAADDLGEVYHKLEYMHHKD